MQLKKNGEREMQIEIGKTWGDSFRSSAVVSKFPTELSNGIQSTELGWVL